MTSIKKSQFLDVKLDVKTLDITPEMKNWGPKTPKQEKREKVAVSAGIIGLSAIATIGLLALAVYSGIAMFAYGAGEEAVVLMAYSSLLGFMTMLGIPVGIILVEVKKYNIDDPLMLVSKLLKKSLEELVGFYESDSDLLVKAVRNGYLNNDEGTEVEELIKDWGKSNTEASIIESRYKETYATQKSLIKDIPADLKGYIMNLKNEDSTSYGLVVGNKLLLENKWKEKQHNFKLAKNNSSLLTRLKP